MRKACKTLPNNTIYDQQDIQVEYIRTTIVRIASWDERTNRINNA